MGQQSEITKWCLILWRIDIVMCEYKRGTCLPELATYFFSCYICELSIDNCWKYQEQYIKAQAMLSCKVIFYIWIVICKISVNVKLAVAGIVNYISMPHGDCSKLCMNYDLDFCLRKSVCFNFNILHPPRECNYRFELI